MTDSIQHASIALAEAQAIADAAAENLDAEHRRAADLHDRKRALETERDAIVADHRAGRGADGAKLALLQLDLADLDAMIAAASAKVADLQTKADAARAAVDARRQALQFQSDLVLLDGLKQQATTIGGKLLAAIDEINAALARLGRRGRAEWLPDTRLANEVRRLDLNRQGLGR